MPFSSFQFLDQIKMEIFPFIARGVVIVGKVQGVEGADFHADAALAAGGEIQYIAVAVFFFSPSLFSPSTFLMEPDGQFFTQIPQAMQLFFSGILRRRRAVSYDRGSAG